MQRWLIRGVLCLSVGATIACGETTNVLTSRDGGTGRNHGGGSPTRPGNESDAALSSGGSGATGGSSGSLPSGGPDASAGSSPLGATGGSGGTAPAATGGVAGRSAATGGVAGRSVTDAATPITAITNDPRGAQRQMLVDQFCSLFDEHPCLQGGFSQDADCRVVENVSTYNAIPQQCWSSWVSLMECITTAHYQCPCSDCALYDDGTGSQCPTEKATLTACLRPFNFAKSVTGKKMLPCNWDESADGTTCFIDCGTIPVMFHGDCTGVPGGPYVCDISLNGHQLMDDATGQAVSYYSPDCASAAQKLADGEGMEVLDCCFTWAPTDDGRFGSAVVDAGGLVQCSCTADPTKAGFPTCAAAAAAGRGKVVPLCLEYANTAPTSPF